MYVRKWDGRDPNVMTACAAHVSTSIFCQGLICRSYTYYSFGYARINLEAKYRAPFKNGTGIVHEAAFSEITPSDECRRTPRDLES